MRKTNTAIQRPAKAPTHRLDRLRGIEIETDLKPYLKTLAAIKSHNFRRISDAEIEARAARLKAEARSGIDPDRLLPETFALAAEVAVRRLGLRPFDTQLLAGIVMARGRLAELATGEGKTLAATLPAVLYALGGRGVHVMTANDYLAQRDAAWMGPVYRAFGLQATAVTEWLPAARRRRAYGADVTYVTARQAGFDFLRDSLAYDPADVVQREFHIALVDEADFILIDEARVPLVLAAADDGPDVDPVRADEAARGLEPGRHFVLDRAARSLHLTPSGERRVREILGVGGMHEERFRLVYAAVYVALQARHLLARDADYIVRNGRIALVDELTGRVARDRRWPHGIQAALELKEGLAVRSPGRIFGSITVQHLLNLYPLRAAMTATAVPAAVEFNLFFGLGVVVIPPHQPCRRRDEPDSVFLTAATKQAALISAIEQAHRTGRPVLVGTRTVGESESLAKSLRVRGLEVSVLNAKNDRREAAVIARAGLPGAVTISTNMAGRGTDIKLGGAVRLRSPQEERTRRKKIEALGGLLVIGTNRHESVRIDGQLRGRSGRQGDPGESRFFVSLEDELFRRYGVAGFLPKKILERAQADSNRPVADARLVREVERAQSIIEHQNYLIRRTLRRYSLLVEEQRRAVQAMRRPALLTAELPEAITEECARDLEKLSARTGEPRARQILSRIFLVALDRFWADHLALVEDLREGIYLQRFGAREPLLEFIRLASDRFREGLSGVIDDCRTELRVRLKRPCKDGDAGALKAPSSTWTYALEDEPLPAFNLGAISGGAGATVFVAMAMFILKAGMDFVSAFRKRAKGREK
jgi:preprotein translocase subunit SecA